MLRVKSVRAHCRLSKQAVDCDGKWRDDAGLPGEERDRGCAVDRERTPERQVENSAEDHGQVHRSPGGEGVRGWPPSLRPIA